MSGRQTDKKAIRLALDLAIRWEKTKGPLAMARNTLHTKIVRETAATGRMAPKALTNRTNLKTLKSIATWGTLRGPLSQMIGVAAGEIRRLRRIEKAARKVMAGLDAKTDAAPSTAKPVFYGVADLHDALNRIT